ncbi:MAG TPA: sulfatase-like hydrolase/transferase [Thermoanaerobaculia bacterium]|nr:sulfatase-like hydrolase/transferase [Thermoanaerobaculia bacterium]
MRLLIDGEHAPDALVEEREIARPPGLGGNRFLTGWWASRKGKQVILSPVAPRARLQMVHLGTLPRTLALDLEQPPVSPATVRVRAAGRDLGTFPVADPTEIPLPGDLPEGRINVDLTFEPSVRVIAAGIRPFLPAGKVAGRGADIVQSGESLVDMARRISPRTTLVGRFVPPAEPGPDQRFELTVEQEDGSPIRRFSWSPSFWNRILRAKPIELPLGDTDGWVRIRLRARGDGRPGRWEKLGLREVIRAETSPARTLRPFPRPRLVIVYVMDALRADFVGHLGGLPGVSPTFDRLAREGITFRNHRSVAPNTMPSTKALFTGHTFVSRGGWKLLPEDGTTLAEQFKAAGYRTGLFSGNVYVSSAYGTDRGFEHVAEDVLIDGYSQEEKPPFNDNAARAHAAALKWLASLPSGERAFLYFHTIHPHNPYDPPDPYRSRYTAGIPSSIDGSTQTLSSIKARRLTSTPADRRRLRGLYTGSFAYNDAELAGFLKEAAAWAPPGETVMALTADHGEEHFEHGGVLHGFTLFEELLRIPLVLWAPGRLRPAVVTARTDSLDLHATLIGLAGLRRKSDGRPLLPLARNENAAYVHKAAASSVRGGIYSALHGRWKVVWAPRTGSQWGQGDGLGRSRDPEYLFDLQKDPGEQVNLAGDGDLEAAWLRERLLAWVKKHRDEGKGPGEQAVDKKTLDRLKALGYAN